MVKMHFDAWNDKCGAAGRKRGVAASLGSLVLLAACATPPPAGQAMLPNAVTLHTAALNPVVSTETQTLSPALIARAITMQSGTAYQLGSNDIIAVSVYMHPELSVPAVAGVQGGIAGALITGDGTVSLPLVGTVHLGGMTLDEAQDALTADYGSFIKDPKISLNIVQAQSLSYYLLGSFTQPGVKYPVHNLTMLEALALGGSVDLSKADLYQAYVAAGTTKLPVDLHALLVDGDLTQNITLAAGDTIVVPSSENEYAFVFGAISKPGEVLFQSGALSLLQALSTAGLDLTSYTAAELSHVRVIRPGGRQAQFFVVNATEIMNGIAASFALRPGDIIFVPPTAIATWNQVISELLPSLQTVGASLNPFVDIAYLNTH